MFKNPLRMRWTCSEVIVLSGVFAMCLVGVGSSSLLWLGSGTPTVSSLLSLRSSRAFCLLPQLGQSSHKTAMRADVDAPIVHVEVEYNYHLGRSKAYELSCVAKVREWVLQAF
jgi:hypothetical protein